ncbi:polysaccharide deacetylase family protein [Lacticigenium naphthae]|uniref:polysaccharide deacetylase family protein n=1 Tax=Lacticigenium naphthae TaxID=515351 RepID=UPI0004103D57|nr:polysaccharide deacetylase family protein [Lacticigenium naphthae]
MTFSTILYHEIRETDDFDPEFPSPIDVHQAYDDRLPTALFVTHAQFNEQMQYLHDNNFHTLTLDEVKAYYYEEYPLPENSILLTFDDCFQSLKKYAYPLLKEYGFHATAFVVTSWLHEHVKPFDPTQSVCLAQSELNEMKDVFEYANHTDRFHQRSDENTSMMMGATDEALASDLATCNNFVEATDVFAYPFGLFSDRNVDLLAKQHFRLAFTCEQAKNDLQTHPLRLNRYVIPHFLPFAQFKLIVN